jgi:eukaryotic-like serine/threonine-protein kinase
MAPERLLNRPQDHRVDLFALGTVMWEMLTGRRLFYGKSDEEKMRLLLEKAIPPPSSIRPEVPPILDAIVAKALERDPEQRYASGQIMADDLEAVLADVKYHSRMLPALLTELFGSSPSAAHVAMSLIPPEFLTVEATPAAAPAPADTGTEDGATPAGGAPAEAASVTATATTASGTPIRNKKVLLVAAAATMVAMAGVGAALAARSSGRTPPELTLQRTGAAAAPIARPALVVDPPAPEPATIDPTTMPSATGTSDEPVPSAAAKPLRQPAARRAIPGRTAGKVSSGRISRGLSIDPFAEAAAPRIKESAPGLK